MGYIDPRLKATTPHELEILDIVARSPDLRIEVDAEGPSGAVCVRGRGVWARRDSLAEVEVRDLYPPMPEGWDR